MHYHFLTRAEFDAKLKDNAFLEWAWVHGNRRYGTLAQTVLEPLSRAPNLVISVAVQGLERLPEAGVHTPHRGPRMPPPTLPPAQP